MKAEDIEQFLLIIKDREQKIEEAERKIRDLDYRLQMKSMELVYLKTYLKKYHAEVGTDFEEMINQGRSQYNSGTSKFVSHIINP